MSNDLWRWADPNGQQRTVRLDELRAALAEGVIAPNTPVWRAGWNAWQPAHDVPELTSASVGGANGVVLNIPPPPLAMVAVQHRYEATSNSILPSPASVRPAPGAEAEPPLPPAYVPLPARAPTSIHPSSGRLSAAPGSVSIGSSGRLSAPPSSASSIASSGRLPTAQLPTESGSVPTELSSSAVSLVPESAPRVDLSIPTAIGVPPPPELFAAAVAAAAPTPKSVAPPKSIAPPVPLGKPQTLVFTKVEELSDSSLLDDTSSSGFDAHAHVVSDTNGTYGLPGDVALPPPTDPTLHVEGSDDTAVEEAPVVARRAGLSLIFDDLNAIRNGRPPQNKFLIVAIGVVGLSFFIVFIAGVISLLGVLTSSHDSTAAASASAPTKKAAEAPAITSARAPTTTPSDVVAPRPSPTGTKTGLVFGDCVSAGDTKTIAPRATLLQSALEAHALGSSLAFGFATSSREAVALSLDPMTLAPTATVRARASGGDARRVTPLLVAGKLTAIPDVDRKTDRLVGRRVVATSALIDVGSADGSIVWAPHGRDSFAKLFDQGGEGNVDAIHAVALDSASGVAMTFRRGNSINIGVAKGDSVLDAAGELSTIAGLGQVGSPAIGVSGERVIVAWADRASASDDYGIRWTRVDVGASTSEATPFSVPEGGPGGQAMSPSVAPLGGGRFLLAWAEGPASNHQVRAITMGSDGLPSGAPITISTPGINAGQPAAVVGPDGRGAVAFLVAKGKSLEIRATPIRCPAQ